MSYVGFTGAELIAIERQRQQLPKKDGGEGWDADHDRGHWAQLALAAVCYALPDGWRVLEWGGFLRLDLRTRLWPWGDEWWKPTPKDRTRELVKAGALIAAAIDSLEGSK